MCIGIKEILVIVLLSAGVRSLTFDGYDNYASVDEGSCAPSYPKANADPDFVRHNSRFLILVTVTYSITDTCNRYIFNN
jgi:hypothetical protein